MKFQSILTATAVATSTLQADGSISISIVLSKQGADGQSLQFAQSGHYISPADAHPLTEAPPSAAEVELGLSLRDIVTARGLVYLCEKHKQPFADLLPESLRPAEPKRDGISQIGA